MVSESSELSRIIKRQRISIPLTLTELAKMSNVSSSHLGRIEREERFPSARVLRKIAKPLGFDEDELFVIAGLKSPKPVPEIEKAVIRGIDPYVAMILAREPVEVQRTVISIFVILKSITKRTT